MKILSLRFIAGLILFAALVGTPVIRAQTSKGILAGVVRDRTGAVVTNATVTGTSQDTSETRTVSTGSTGSYRVGAINPGVYEIHVDKAGFKTTDVKGVKVDPSVVTTYDPLLEIGAVDVMVNVEANGNVVNTENGQLSGTID